MMSNVGCDFVTVRAKNRTVRFFRPNSSTRLKKATTPLFVLTVNIVLFLSMLVVIPVLNLAGTADRGQTPIL
jgi:hypothetical protein